eukprot:TRINITY_DN27732_c2_g1_i2.p2 TRINITY_DN27732_c2_g1~~TRINITY_DN27732_c2_g1_i2.p2  ORF type:complete len:228 (-),score=39.64 TRINITY_DN27732_c2_g1_i2:298-981(-)
MGQTYSGTIETNEYQQVIADEDNICTLVKQNDLSAIDALGIGVLADWKDSSGVSALHLAVRKNNPDMIFKLVQHGARFDVRDKLGRCPLHEAAYNAQVEVVKMLVACGANVDATDKQGRTALHLAATNFGDIQKKLVIMDFLAQQSCCVVARDEEGRSPLHIACIEGNKDAALRLIHLGANRCQLDKYEKRPLDLAIIRGHKMVEKCLRQYDQETVAGKIKQYQQYL